MTRQKEKKGGKVFKRKRESQTKVFCFFFLSSAQKRKKKIMVYPMLTFFQFSLKEKMVMITEKKQVISDGKPSGNHVQYKEIDYGRRLLQVQRRK